MIRNPLIPAAAILAAACFACVPPPSSGPVLVGASVASSATCNPGNFQSKVSYLTTAFQPRLGASRPPTGALPNPSGAPDYAADLGKAYCAASDAFRQQLDSLDYVYINAVACAASADCFAESWGWRRSQTTGGPQRIIALSSGFWTGPHPRAAYSVYETDLAESILPPSTGVSFQNANVDDFATTLVAALAHEMAHIRYYDLVGSNPANYCSNKFYNTVWNQPVQPPPAWRRLLTLTERDYLRSHGQWPNSHKSPPHFADIDHPGLGGTPRNQLIFQLLAQSQPWASLFAATAPDEDFIETYKFKVLTTAVNPLKSVVISIAGITNTANIVADYVGGYKTDLATKVGCIPNSL